ncbi:MAG: nucleotidyltransferase family protein [Myxococcota bacterium]
MPAPGPSRAFQLAAHVAGGPAVDASGVDPGALLQVLRRHKLLAHAQHVGGLMEAQRELLKPSWRAGTAANLAQASERDRVIAALHADYIPCIAYKGVVLQEWLHGRVDGRDSEDLDLWVPPLLFRRTCRWAVADGYTLAFDLTLDDLNARELPSELLLFHPSGMHLDVHQRFFASHYALDAVEDWFEQYVPWLDEQSPVEIARFDDLATAFMVVLTAGKDCWATLRHLSDVALALERVDPVALADLADRTHTRGILDIGAQLAARHLGRCTGWVAKFPVPDGADAALLHEGELPLVQRARIYLSARERRRDRLAYAARLPFKVSALDLKGGPVPMPRTARRLVRLVRTRGPFAGT